MQVHYQHIKVTLLPDPDDGEQPRVLIEIVFHRTRGYLGEKDAYVRLFYAVYVVTSVCVAVANEPCLLHCPHIPMLAFTLREPAFAAPSLTSSE